MRPQTLTRDRYRTYLSRRDGSGSSRSAGWSRPGCRAVKQGAGGRPHDTPGRWAGTRGRSRAGGEDGMTPLYLGWEYAAPGADPGPPPRLPVPPRRPELSAGWLAAQRHEEDLLARPLRIHLAALGVLVIVLSGCAAAGWVTVLVAVPLLLACLVAAGLSGQALWRGEQVLRRRIDAERTRVEVLRADSESRLHQAQAEYARLMSEWQRERTAFARQKRWHAVPVPAGTD